MPDWLLPALALITLIWLPVLGVWAFGCVTYTIARVRLRARDRRDQPDPIEDAWHHARTALADKRVARRALERDWQIQYQQAETRPTRTMAEREELCTSTLEHLQLVGSPDCMRCGAPLSQRDPSWFSTGGHQSDWPARGGDA